MPHWRLLVEHRNGDDEELKPCRTRRPFLLEVGTCAAHFTLARLHWRVQHAFPFLVNSLYTGTAASERHTDFSTFDKAQRSKVWPETRLKVGTYRIDESLREKPFKWQGVANVSRCPLIVVNEIAGINHRRCSQ